MLPSTQTVASGMTCTVSHSGPLKNEGALETTVSAAYLALSAQSVSHVTDLHLVQSTLKGVLPAGILAHFFQNG